MSVHSSKKVIKINVKITAQYPSNLSKLYERAMHTRVYKYFEKIKLLYNFLFGFRRKHSTNHAIVSIVEDIHKNLDKNDFVCGVFIDLEKAFDTVNHEILIKTRFLWHSWCFQPLVQIVLI